MGSPFVSFTTVLQFLKKKMITPYTRLEDVLINLFYKSRKTSHLFVVTKLFNDDLKIISTFKTFTLILR